MWLLRRISLPHLLDHRARTALTVLGIALGIAAMVATTSVTEAVFRSFRHGVEVTAGRADVQLSNGSAGVPEDLVDEAAGTQGVAAASALVEGFVPLAAHDGDLLAVFGLDLLGDREHDAQLPRTAVEVPDEVLFVSRPDSLALAKPFALARGYTIGSTIEVLTPDGIRQLVVRGLVDPVGPASLFGGVVGLMDIPAAQRLLGKNGIVDRVDVRLHDTAARAEVMAALAVRATGRAQVEDVTVHGARAEDLLFSVRVMLSIAALVAVVVGFFLIHHTVSVSVLQRRKEIVLLNALGVSRRAIVLWLGAEAITLGTLASLLGYGIGLLLARVSLASMGTVATAFAPLPPPEVPVSPSMLFLAVGVGLAATCAATAAPAWSVVSAAGARFLHPAPDVATSRPWRALMASFLGLLTTAALIVFSPRTLPYRPLVAFIFIVNSLTLVSCALLSPVAALALGHLVASVATRTRGLSLLLASRSVARNPAAPTAVITAIVLGLGWTLADASLIDSFRSSWLGWLDQQYQSDLTVSGGSATVSFLTAPPFSDEIARELRSLPGVGEVQGERIVDIMHGGRPTALQAIDGSSHGLRLLDGSWDAVAWAFQTGEGVVVSRQLAHLSTIGRGDTMTIQTPAGERSFPVLGVFTDFRVGTLGNITMSRALYSTLWHDTLVNSVRVWVEPGANVAAVRSIIQSRFGRTHGLHAVTAGEFRTAVGDLISNIFALHYTVVVIALLVSVVGVTNFLLTAVLDRQPELRSLSASGVSARDVRQAIEAEGALLGVVGGAIGLVAGGVVARIIVLHSVPMVNGWLFDFRFPTPTALRLAVGAVALAAVAGILPAHLATRRHVIPQELRE